MDRHKPIHAIVLKARQFIAAVLLFDECQGEVAPIRLWKGTFPRLLLGRKNEFIFGDAHDGVALIT